MIDELTPTEPPPIGVVVDDPCARLQAKYDLLVKQAAELIGIIVKLKAGTLKIEEVDLKTGARE